MGGLLSSNRNETVIEAYPGEGRTLMAGRPAGGDPRNGASCG
jgi:hypothetical protein